MLTNFRVSRPLVLGLTLGALTLPAIARQGSEPKPAPAPTPAPAPAAQPPKPASNDDMTNPITGSKPVKKEAPAPKVDAPATPAAAPAKTDAAKPADGKAPIDTKDWKTFTAEGITFQAPPSWEVETPTKSMFTPAAQFKLPAADAGKDGAVLKVFTGIRGGVGPNIARWVAQIKDPIAEPKQTDLEVGGVKVTQVEVTGTFSAGMMGQQAGAPQKDTMLLGAIAEVESGDVQFKAVGPKDVLVKHRAEWDAMLKTIKLVKK